MRNYRPLPSRSLTSNTTICRPDPPRPVTLDSPATEVLTDLRHVYAAVIEPHATMDSANQYMIQRGVRLLLVVNSDKSLAGLITANDIQGEKPMRFVRERGVKHNEILVSDIMTPQNDLDAIPMTEVASAKVGHILAGLNSTGRHHALAIESDAAGRLTVRGIFSLSQIARQLGVAIQTTEVAKSFAEIEAMLTANSALG